VTLSGPSGNGKTLLAAGLMQRLDAAQIRIERAAWLSAAEFALEVWDARSCHSGQESATIRRYATYDLLLLDDLGAEQEVDHARQAIYILLNRRWEDCRRTIVTTNCSLGSIAKHLRAPIADRLIRAGEFIDVPGSSWALAHSLSQPPARGGAAEP